MFSWDTFVYMHLERKAFPWFDSRMYLGVRATCSDTKHEISCHGHTDRFSKHLLWDVRTGGCRVMSELEKAIAILFIYLFIYSQHPDLSSFLCRLQDLGQGSWKLLSAAIRIRPKFRVSLHGVNDLVTSVLKYPVVHRQKVWLHFSPPTLVGGVSSVPPTQNQLHGAAVLGCVFVQEPPQIPRAMTGILW